MLLGGYGYLPATIFKIIRLVYFMTPIKHHCKSCRHDDSVLLGFKFWKACDYDTGVVTDCLSCAECEASMPIVSVAL